MHKEEFVREVSNIIKELLPLVIEVKKLDVEKQIQLRKELIRNLKNCKRSRGYEIQRIKYEKQQAYDLLTVRYGKFLACRLPEYDELVKRGLCEAGNLEKQAEYEKLRLYCTGSSEELIRLDKEYDELSDKIQALHGVDLINVRKDMTNKICAKIDTAKDFATVFTLALKMAQYTKNIESIKKLIKVLQTLCTVKKGKYTLPDGSVIVIS